MTPVSHGKPCAGNPHARFEEGDSAQAEPRRSALLHNENRTFGLKALHVTTGIDPKSGGPTRSVKGLCRALASSGVGVTLLVLRGNHPFENPCGVKVVYGTMPDVSQFDIVHIHGLWDLGLHSVAKMCRRAGVKCVISPRGMLDPWALSVKRWKKIIAMFLYQRHDLAHAAAFHATAEAEAAHIRAQGFKQLIIISPNAVEVPETMPPVGARDENRIRTALFLSRIHPGKGLLTLADAWARVRPVGWRMKVVGPDSYGHKREVVARLEQLGIASDWEFIDMLDDAEKWVAYRNADLLVHPSVSENFGITIAEGLAAGLPVIATKGTPWQELEERKCGWWIDVGVEPLAKALKMAVVLSCQALAEMGERGRKLVKEKYTWDAVVKAMVKGYANTAKQVKAT